MRVTSKAQWKRYLDIYIKLTKVQLKSPTENSLELGSSMQIPSWEYVADWHGISLLKLSRP